MLKIENVSKIVVQGRKSGIVLQNIHLVFPKNGFVALYGDIASSSALLQIIGGGDPSFFGELFFRDIMTKNGYYREWREQSRTSITLIDKSSTPLLHLTVMENLELALMASVYTPADRARRLEYLIGQFHLESLRAKLPRDLSSGQMRMVSIACGMAKDPDILLLDNILDDVSPAERERFLSQLRALAKDHLILLSAPYPLLSPHAGDRLIEFRRNAVISDSCPQCLHAVIGTRPENIHSCQPASFALLCRLTVVLLRERRRAPTVRALCGMGFSDDVLRSAALLCRGVPLLVFAVFIILYVLI